MYDRYSYLNIILYKIVGSASLFKTTVILVLIIFILLGANILCLLAKFKSAV